MFVMLTQSVCKVEVLLLQTSEWTVLSENMGANSSTFPKLGSRDPTVCLSGVVKPNSKGFSL